MLSARRVCAAIVALLAVICVMYGQVTTGTIRGLVSDPSGAVILGAQVKSIDLDTGRVASTETTNAGIYVLVNLPVGRYRLEATAAGFKTFLREPVTVDTASTTDLNIQLEIGKAAETLTVTGETVPLVKTDSAEMSTVMEQKLVSDLPIEVGGPSAASGSGRRQIEEFIFLTPGVVGTQWGKHLDGSQQMTAQSLIDGVPMALQQTPGFTPTESPPFDSIQEFKVSTTQFTADQGRGFGLINYTTKSGTNQWHGDAYWLVRNTDFDARGFFDETTPIEKQNEFGGSFGGPVIKNRTFIFASYQGFRLAGGPAAYGDITIPDLALRSGDFSGYTSTNGSVIPIYDPATTQPDGMGGYTREPFPGNVIPASRIVPQASNYLALMPPPDNSNVVGNYVNRSSTPADDDVWLIKANHSQGPHNFAFTFWHNDYPSQGLDPWGAVPIDSGYTQTYYSDNVRFNWDWAISPTLLNHFGYGHAGNKKNYLPLYPSASGNPINIPGISPDVNRYPGVDFNPIPSPTGVGGSYQLFGNADAGDDLSRDHANIFMDSLSKTMGRHQFKFGGEVWFQQLSVYDSRSEGGDFTFDNLSTSLPDASNSGSLGNPFASFLLGQVWSSSRRVNPVWNPTNTRYFVLFIDDKFQVTPRLTLSLGLRWELPTTIYEANNTISAMNMKLPNPAAGGIPGAYVFGNGPNRTAFDKTEFGPRLGIAYKVTDKTVVRTGFAVLYAQTNASNMGGRPGGQLLLGGYTATQNPTTLNNGVTPALTLTQGYPAFPYPLPSSNPGIFVNDLADWIDPTSGRNTYTQNWNFTIERQLPWGMASEIAYVGNNGHRLSSDLANPDQVDSQYLSLGSLLTQPYNSPAAIAAGIKAPFPGFQGSVAQALRPFPQYTSVVVQGSPTGNDTYNALQAKVEKRFRNGLSFLASYTMSKNLSDVGSGIWSNSQPIGLDNHNQRLEKSLTPYDEPQVFLLTWIYDVPRLKTDKWLAKKLLEGWEVGMTQTYNSDLPLSVTGGTTMPIFGGGQRPSRVPGVARLIPYTGSFDPAKDILLNINAYTDPGPYTFGNVGPTEPGLRCFFYSQENMMLARRIPLDFIREGFNVQIRAEAFNLLNRVIFADPNSSINSPQSFGIVTGQNNTPRQIQLGLRVTF